MQRRSATRWATALAGVASAGPLQAHEAREALAVAAAARPQTTKLTLD